MKLSIIVPVYRVEKTLDRCLRSILNQSFKDYELLLIDDGSPDSCPQLCDEWAARDERIHVFHQANGGLSKARNTGIDAARGEYITFIDSDDYIGVETLSELMDHIGDCDILEYPIWRFYGSPQQSMLVFEEKSFTVMEDYWLQARAYQHSYACNKIYRRQLFHNVRYPEGRVYEDLYTLPKLLRHCRRVATTTRGLYYYCWNEKGITATSNGEQLRQLLDAHLSSGMPIDDRYYMRLLNIQMDVYELTSDKPRLKKRWIKPRGSIKQILKTVTLNILGIKGICSTNKLLHRIAR